MDNDQRMTGNRKAGWTGETEAPPVVPTEEGKKAAVTETIQQLGQTGLPTGGESNVFCMTIIGQIEGHLVLPPQNKRPNTSI